MKFEITISKAGLKKLRQELSKIDGFEHFTSEKECPNTDIIKELFYEEDVMLRLGFDLRDKVKVKEI